MQWEPDVTVGQWLNERLDAELSTSMHGVVPTGFPAYARVFHRAHVRSLPGGVIPSPDEWVRLQPAEQNALMERFVDAWATWADAAAAFGTTMHPLAQWHRIVRTPTDQARANTNIAPDGREFDPPAEGDPDPDIVARIVRHAIDGATPGYAALWEGWGGLLGSKHSSGRAFWTFGEVSGTSTAEEDPRHAAMLNASISDPLNEGVLSAKWHDGILPREVSEGPRLELPARSHVLFAGDLNVFTNDDWPLDVPWRDHIGEAHGFPPSAQAPSLIWPADRSWVIVSEIDFDSTIVAGPASLIAALVADPALEAFEIPGDADLTWDADRVNG